MKADEYLNMLHAAPTFYDKAVVIRKAALANVGNGTGNFWGESWLVIEAWTAEVGETEVVSFTRRILAEFPRVTQPIRPFTYQIRWSFSLLPPTLRKTYCRLPRPHWRQPRVHWMPSLAKPRRYSRYDIHGRVVARKR